MPPRRPKSQRRILAGTAVTLLASAVLTACGGDADRGRAPAAEDFAATRDAGRGQTVRWWMFGGDDKVNAYVDDTVAPAARRLGVKIERVPVGSSRLAGLPVSG